MWNGAHPKLSQFHIWDNLQQIPVFYQLVFCSVFLHKCINFFYVWLVEPLLFNWFYGYMINIVRRKKIYVIHSAYFFQLSKKQSS